jgi:Ser/Thr protein kinase RdoA (MazF antagonist)
MGLPHVISSGPADCDGAQGWTVVREFVRGRDLTRLVTDTNVTLTPQRIGVIGRSVGAALGRLHRASSSPLVRDLLGGDLNEPARRWAGKSIDDVRSLAERVEAALAAGILDEDLGSARRAIATLKARNLDGRHRPEVTNPCLIHGDAHGGNIIVDVAPETGLPEVTFIDEQLVVADAAFDVASIQNWAAEVLPDGLLRAFLGGLRSGYSAEAAMLTTQHAMLVHCHALRALGRLAYYARPDPRWVEPYGPARLHRQVALLEKLADDETPWTVRVDSMRHLRPEPATHPIP